MYQAEVTHNKELNFTARTGKAEFIIDAKSDGITPLDALLAGLASCIGVYIRKYAEGSKLELNNFKVKASAELSKEAPVCFKYIEVVIDLKGACLEERRVNALLNFIKNCPAHGTLKNNPQIEFKLSC